MHYRKQNQYLVKDRAGAYEPFTIYAPTLWRLHQTMCRLYSPNGKYMPISRAPWDIKLQPITIGDKRERSLPEV